MPKKKISLFVGTRLEDFRTEYAKSSRSKCRSCNDFIMEVTNRFLINMGKF
jgi:hypothetical protein